jgi:hypothetical protein
LAEVFGPGNRTVGLDPRTYLQCQWHHENKQTKAREQTNKINHPHSWVKCGIPNKQKQENKQTKAREQTNKSKRTNKQNQPPTQLSEVRHTKRHSVGWCVEWSAAYQTPQLSEVRHTKRHSVEKWHTHTVEWSAAYKSKRTNKQKQENKQTNTQLSEVRHTKRHSVEKWQQHSKSKTMHDL